MWAVCTARVTEVELLFRAREPPAFSAEASMQVRLSTAPSMTQASTLPCTTLGSLSTDSSVFAPFSASSAGSDVGRLSCAPSLVDIHGMQSVGRIEPKLEAPDAIPHRAEADVGWSWGLAGRLS